MGASFTATMWSKNTHAVAAHPGGEKVQKPSKWDISVIDHIWLEECFISWSNLPTDPIKGSKYRQFPDGINYSTILQDRGFGGFREEMPRPGVGSRLVGLLTSPPWNESGSPPPLPPPTAESLICASSPVVPERQSVVPQGMPPPMNWILRLPSNVAESKGVTPPSLKQDEIEVIKILFDCEKGGSAGGRCAKGCGLDFCRLAVD